MDNDGASVSVDDAVAMAMERLARSVVPTGAHGREILDPLMRLASRGKRMRPLLLMAAHAAAGGGREDVAIRVSAALEIFQVAALVHDDVIDGSNTRRGMPSAHRALQEQHVGAGWRGDAAQFGVHAAILAGDLALMTCMRELVAALSGVEPAIAAEVGERFATMATVCTAGQYLDLRLAAQRLEGGEQEREAVLLTMRTKTASYTTEGPLALGAALAGRSHDEVDAWAAVGVPLGVAFQLRDDVLGVVGSEEQTGKPAGDDVREGKRTLLIAHGLATASPADGAVLMNGMGSADPFAVASAIEVLVKTGAIEAVEREILTQVDLATGRLDAIAMEDRFRERLLGLFAATTARVA